MDWTAVAAFAAAGLSLINVALSYRLTSRGRLEEWRRTEMRPIVARILTLSSDASDRWRAVGALKASYLKSHDDGELQAVAQYISEGWDYYQQLRLQVAELDLIAHSSVRDAAQTLLSAHKRISSVVGTPGEEMDVTEMKEVIASRDEISRHEESLMTRVRADLGIDRPGRKGLALLWRSAE